MNPKTSIAIICTLFLLSSTHSFDLNHLLNTKPQFQKHSLQDAHSVKDHHSKLKVQFTPTDLTDMTSEFFYQLVRELGIFDFNTCSGYGFTFVNYLTDSVYAFMANDFFLGVLKITYAINLSPVVFKECMILPLDVNTFLEGFNTIQFKDLSSSAFMLVMNLVFNSVDIYYEVLTLNTDWQAGNYQNVGAYSAKIFSDVLYKNPWMTNWSYQNSEVITKVLSSTSPIVQSNVMMHEQAIPLHQTRTQKLSLINDILANQSKSLNIEKKESFIKEVEELLKLY